MLYRRQSPYAKYHWAVCRSDLRGVLAFAETMKEAAELSSQFYAQTVIVCLGVPTDMHILRDTFNFCGLLVADDMG